MKKFIKKIINGTVYLLQNILIFLVTQYLSVFVTNFGFKSKSKTLVKYTLHALEYKSFSRKILRKKRPKMNKLNIQNAEKNNKQKTQRLNLKRFVLFKFFDFQNKNSKPVNSNGNIAILKKQNTNILIQKKRFKKRFFYSSFFFLNSKLNKKYFNLTNVSNLKKKFSKLLALNNSKFLLKKRIFLSFLLITKSLNNRQLFNICFNTKRSLFLKNLYYKKIKINKNFDSASLSRLNTYFKQKNNIKFDSKKIFIIFNKAVIKYSNINNVNIKKFRNNIKNIIKKKQSKIYVSILNNKRKFTIFRTNKVFLKKINILKTKNFLLILKKEFFLFFLREKFLYQKTNEQFYKIFSVFYIIYAKLLKVKNIRNSFLQKRKRILSINNNSFSLLYLIKKFIKSYVKYNAINKKRFYKQYSNKKIFYFLLKNKSKKHFFYLNFSLFLQNYYLYNKKHFINRRKMFKAVFLKKNMSIRNYFVHKLFAYSAKNTTHLNFFLNIKKMRRKQQFFSLFKLFNNKFIIKYIQNQKNSKKGIFIKKLKKNLLKKKNLTFLYFKKILILKNNKLLIYRKLKSFLFLESYIKIYLFNFIFYRYLTNVLSKNKHIVSLNYFMEKQMKTYILKRVKIWSTKYYKAKNFHLNIYKRKTYKNSNMEEHKLITAKKLHLLKKGKFLIKNAKKLVFLNKARVISKKLTKCYRFIENKNNIITFLEKYKYIILQLTKKNLILKKKNLLVIQIYLKKKKNEMYLKKIYSRLNNSKKIQKTILNSITNFYTKDFIFFFRAYFLLRKKVYFFKFKNMKKKNSNVVYRLIHKRKNRFNFLYIFTKHPKLFRSFFNRHKKIGKYFLSKLTKYKKYLVNKYYYIYYSFLNSILYKSYDIWLSYKKEKFLELYKRFFVILNKNINKKKNSFFSVNLTKKLKKHLYTSSSVYKKNSKKLRLYKNLSIMLSNLYFVKTKNKSQLKNYVHILNRKIIKERTEDLRIQIKKDFIKKSKNYLLNTLYKRVSNIKRKKYLIVSLLKTTKNNINNKGFLKNNNIFLKKHFIFKYKELKFKYKNIFNYFFNSFIIKKINVFVDYIYNKNFFLKTKNKKIYIGNTKKLLIKIIKTKLLKKSFYLILVNKRYSKIFSNFYKKIFIKSFIKLKIFKQYKINKRVKASNVFLKKKYNNSIIKRIYLKKLRHIDQAKSFIQLNIKLKRKKFNRKFNDKLINQSKLTFKTKGYYFKLKLKKIKLFYNIQKLDIINDNSYYNIAKNKVNYIYKKNKFSELESSNPFSLFRKIFFKKGSFFDSLFFTDDLFFENVLRNKFSFEFLESYDNRFDRELPIDEFFFMDNAIQNKKTKGFIMAQPFTLPLLNILLNDTAYLKRNSITKGKAIRKIQTLNDKITIEDSFLNTKDVENQNWDCFFNLEKYETSNRNLLKSLLFSTMNKYLDYESNHDALLKQKNFVSHITLLFYEYEQKTNKKKDLFTLLGLITDIRGMQNSTLNNYENRFKQKNSLQDSYLTLIENETGVRLDDKSVDNDELYSSFANREGPLDFYNDIDVFKMLGKTNTIFNPKEKMSYKITNFFKNKAVKKNIEEDIEDRIRQYYSHKIVKGSLLTGFDSFLVNKYIKKPSSLMFIQNYYYRLIYRLLFYFFFSGVKTIINYFQIYFKFKNINTMSSKTKITLEEKKLWIDLLNIIYLLLQESLIQNIDYVDLKKENYKYQKTILKLLKTSFDFEMQVEKIKLFEISLINNFNLLVLQQDFDKKFFLEELLSLFNIEESDWFLLKDSLFYKKASKDFKIITNKSPFIQRSLDVMLKKNKDILDIYNKKIKNKNKTINRKYKRFQEKKENNTTEQLQSLIDHFSHKTYNKMKTYRFAKRDLKKRKYDFRKTLEKRRKNKHLLNVKSLSIFEEKTKVINTKKLQENYKFLLTLEILKFVMKKRNINKYVKRIGMKKIFYFIKNLKKYRKKNIKGDSLRKLNLIKSLQNKKEKNFSDFKYSLIKYKKENIIKTYKTIFISDLTKKKLKAASFKYVLTKKYDLKQKNAFLLNYNNINANKKKTSVFLDNVISDYQQQYWQILSLILHSRKKYRKYVIYRKLKQKILSKIILNYFRKNSLNKEQITYKINRSRNLKMYFKYVSAKLYRRRLFFYLLNLKKFKMENRYYKLKINKKWSKRDLYLDKDMLKYYYSKRVQKLTRLHTKYTKKITKPETYKKKLIVQNMFKVKVLRMLRSKFQSKFFDRFYTKDELINKYLNTFYSDKDNLPVSSSVYLNNRSLYLLGFNSEIFDLNLTSLNETNTDDFVEDKLHKYSFLSKGFYMFDHFKLSNRTKRMFYRNFYLKKIMYRNKFLDYRQINRNKYILKKIEKTKYRFHSSLKRQHTSILNSLKKNKNLKYYFIKKYVKFSFSFLLKYFINLIYKRFTKKKNIYTYKKKLEYIKFANEKLFKQNKTHKIKINTIKNSFKFSINRQLENIVCFFIYKKKFVEFFTNKFTKKLSNKISNILKFQDRKLSDKFMNFYIYKERKNMKSLFKKSPLKLINKIKNTKASFYNIEVAFYKKISSIIKRNVIIKNQHNYSWSSMSQESKTVNYLIKSRSLNYNTIYKSLFMESENDTFVSKNFFKFKLPFVRKNELHIVNDILNKFDNFYFNLWQKIEKYRINKSPEKIEKITKEDYISNPKTKIIKTEILFLQWLIRLNTTIIFLSKYLKYSLIILLFFFSFVILNLNFQHSIFFLICSTYIIYPFYYFVFQYFFRMIKLGHKLYFLSYLRKPKMMYTVKFFGFNINKTKNLTVFFFKNSMSFFYCNNYYTRVIILFLIQVFIICCSFSNYTVDFLSVFKLYILLIIILFFLLTFFNIKPSGNISNMILGLLFRILILETPWFCCLWIFTLFFLIEHVKNYFKNVVYPLPKESKYDYLSKYLKIEEYVINFCLFKLNYNDDCLDFVFYKEFFNLKNVQKEEKIYIKYKKYMKENM